MKLSGIITKKHEKGFGFIKADGQEYFFHLRDLLGCRFEQLQVGSCLEFELAASRHKPNEKQAVKLRLPAGVASEADRAAGQSPGGSTQNYPPYRFLPLDTTHSVMAAPVFHDGGCPDDGAETLSGEILCRLEALTPLLAGNQRYQWQQRRSELDNLSRNQDIKHDKAVVEPLRLEDGRVVIPGASLKGMLRHSLSGLLQAPMEKVAERHYTYRPNLQVQENDNIVTRPAVWVGGEQPRVWVLRDARAAVFVRNAAESAINVAKTKEEQIQKGRRIPGISLQSHAGGARIVPGRDWTPDEDWAVLSYQGGIDGNGYLARRAETLTLTYKLALVPQGKLEDAEELPVSQEVLQAYYLTQKVLADRNIGHLCAHPRLESGEVDQIARAIDKSTALEPWQLIYVEVALDQGELNQHSRVLSLGHHFRYRWAYTSSVRYKKGQLRPDLAPQPDEIAPANSKPHENRPPKQLTGARLLMGYVNDNETRFGTGRHARLAGRLAFNHALSEGVPEFLGTAEQHHAVFLPILGQPKSSAWEFYLRQPQAGKKTLQASSALPKTWGDLPNDPGGDLAGRKYYPHQPTVKTQAHLESRDPAVRESDQASIARYICAPASRFRFTLRFANLRPWELAAVLAALEPARLDPQQAPRPYAHKLGLGRPLGMGSVRITIDSVNWRKTYESRLHPADTATLQNLTQDLQKRLDLPGRDRWLEMHHYRDQGRLDYPRAKDRDGVWQIYEWHTAFRREYSQQRRLAPLPQEVKIEKEKQAALTHIETSQPKSDSPNDESPAGSNAEKKIILAITAGTTDLQLVLQDNFGQLHRGYFATKNRMLHQALLDEKIVFQTLDLDPKSLSERILADPTGDTLNPEAELSVLGDEQIKLKWLSDQGKYFLLLPKLAGLKKRLALEGLRISELVVFNTQRNASLPRIGSNEPIAAWKAISESFAQLMEKPGSECKAINVAVEFESLEDKTTGLLMQAAVDRIDAYFKTVSTDLPKANLALALNGGPPSIRSYVLDAAQLYFPTDNIEVYLSTQTSFFKPGLPSPGEIARIRRLALHLIQRGGFVEAYGATLDIQNTPNKYDWLQLLQQASDLFSGNLSNIKTTTRFAAMEEIKHHIKYRCLLPAFRAEAALHAQRHVEAIAWSITFFDAALLDGIEKKFDAKYNDLNRTITINTTPPTHTSDGLAPHLINIIKKGPPFKCNTMGDKGEEWIKSIGTPIETLFNTISKEISNNNQEIFLNTEISNANNASSYFAETSRDSADNTAGSRSSYSIKQYRNINAHSRLSEQELNNARSAFQTAGLWAPEPWQKQGQAFLSRPLIADVLDWLLGIDAAALYESLVAELTKALLTPKPADSTLPAIRT